nr:RnfABCDGE type electron transport complex subunit D [Laribacter sp.]
FLKTQLAAGHDLLVSGTSPIFGLLAGVGSEWVALAWLAGGLALLAARVISWQAPVALLATLGLLSGLFHLIDPARYASPVLHLFAGATMLGAWFIATDPVSGSTTPRGKLVFGAGAGLCLWVIRTFGSFPDAMAFSVLMMNMAVPLIDRYTQPPVFGHKTARGRP